MKNILVIGADGQLGFAMKCATIAIPSSPLKFFYTGKDTVDICNIDSIRNYVNENNINLIVNLVAYTNVEKAEDDIVAAFNVNAYGAKNLADVCKDTNTYLIHISTDYVFDGVSTEPYKPYDTKSLNPKTVYGKSKLEGETFIKNSRCLATIIRTSWLYSMVHKNFFNTIKSLAEEKKQIKVVNDQYGSPTFANDLAYYIICLIYDIMYDDNKPEFRILHYSNEGVTTWYDFAKAIIINLGYDCEVIGISSEDYKSKAQRPSYSVLDISDVITSKKRHWTKALAELTDMLTPNI